jgi:hypothetical protein
LGEIKDGTVDVVGCVLGAMFFPDAVKAFRHVSFLLRLLWSCPADNRTHTHTQ